MTTQRNGQPPIEALTFYLNTPKYFDTTCHSPIIAVQYGERGYWPISIPGDPDADAAPLNVRNGWSTEELDAALAGSMWGWDCPAAQPAIEAIRNNLAILTEQ